jgi:uncharacterized protein with GYD domain
LRYFRTEKLSSSGSYKPVLEPHGQGINLGDSSEKGGRNMSTYVILATYTEQGAKRIRDIGKATDSWKDDIEKAGGKLVSFYSLMGSFDFVVIVEYPSDEAALQRLLSLAMRGDFKTTTCKAFSSEEYAKIVKRIG